MSAVRQLPFFCTAVKTAVVDELGYLDPAYIHYGSDSDYCQRALRAGYQLIWVHDVYVQNKLSPLIKEWKEHDRWIFKNKYGW